MPGACAWIALAIGLTGCAGPLPEPSAGHLAVPAEASADAGAIPPPVVRAPRVPPPSMPEPTERYTVVVDDVPVGELLFALARDAELEIDIIGDIEGTVTMNATDATLPRLLERIALQAPIRYELHGDYLKIAADVPYVVNYPVPYVNIARAVSSSIQTATQIQSTGMGEEGGGGGAGSNNSSTTLLTESENRFWSTLRRNLAGLLGVDAEEGAAAGGLQKIMLNREAGYVTLRATQRQHREVQAYLDRVVTAARRQVLIEATVVEVTLSDSYQAGVDWALLANKATGLDLVQNLTGTALGGAFNVPDPSDSGAAAVTIGYSDPDTSDGALRSTIKLLSEFGNVRVMSSPKIMALNNQLAILKVVNNRVFFTVDVTETLTDNVVQHTFDTEVNTVPIGLVMTVTPYVGRDASVLLNVRPTVSRILGFVNDPNPDLAAAGVENEIPEIQVREMETMLRIQSGQIAVIGGLMQDSVDRTRRSVPLLGDIPLLGWLFSYHERTIEKTELIIFLRPTVIDEPSLRADFRRFRQYLPDSDLPDSDLAGSAEASRESAAGGGW